MKKSGADRSIVVVWELNEAIKSLESNWRADAIEFFERQPEIQYSDRHYLREDDSDYDPTDVVRREDDSDLSDDEEGIGYREGVKQYWTNFYTTGGLSSCPEKHRQHEAGYNGTFDVCERTGLNIRFGVCQCEDCVKFRYDLDYSSDKEENDECGYESGYITQDEIETQSADEDETEDEDEVEDGSSHENRSDLYDGD